MRRKLATILTALALLSAAKPSAAAAGSAAAVDQGQILGAYRITETVKTDGCFPERKNYYRNFIWYVIRLGNRTVLLDEDASILNPMEHTNLEVKGDLKKAHLQDTLSMTYGTYGVFTSRYLASAVFDEKDMSGEFTNTMEFKAGTLGNLVLKLWVQSYNALQKVPVHVDSVPAISVDPPCSQSGTLSGVKIDNPRPEMIPQLELDYIRNLRHAEELFPLGKLREMLPILEGITRLYPDRPEAYWRLSRAYFVFSEHSDPDDKKGRLKYLAEAERYARMGLKADPDSGESWFFLTAALGRTATTKGILNALKATGDLERGFLAAAARKPKYNFAGFATAGDTQCGLGIYYRLVPDWWIVKVLTGTRGDIDKAISHLRESIRYQPYRIEYNKELGISLLCRAHRQDSAADLKEGIDVLKKTLEMPTLLGTDDIDKRHIEELLKNPKRACGYSRDGYEDTTIEAYNKIHQK